MVLKLNQFILVFTSILADLEADMPHVKVIPASNFEEMGNTVQVTVEPISRAGGK